MYPYLRQKLISKKIKTQPDEQSHILGVKRKKNIKQIYNTFQRYRATTKESCKGQHFLPQNVLHFCLSRRRKRSATGAYMLRISPNRKTQKCC